MSNLTTESVDRAEAPPQPVEPRDPKQIELILDALKSALATEGEHRLFRAGKLPGLFPARTGLAAQAATTALETGVFETVRTETRAKTVTEWVRVTPAGVRFIQEHDSPKAVLRELREVLGATRSGLPIFLDDARRSVTELAERFEHQTAELVKRLDTLTERVEAALRRADSVGSPTAPSVVPWAETAIAHLDQRRSIGASTNCPLGELFHAVLEVYPALTLVEFHDGLKRLVDTRAIQLSGPQGDAELVDPEYALLCGSEVCCYASR